MPMVGLRRSLYKNPGQLRELVAPGLITFAALDRARELVRPGVTPLELDRAAEELILAAGAESNFKLVPGYSHTLCVSVNENVVHGIPDNRPFVAGDLVSIDCGAQFNGWNGDSALTLTVPGGSIVENNELLNRVTEQSLWVGIAALAGARHLNEVGAAIEEYVEAEAEEHGSVFGILTDFVGHGIGRSMHEEPPVFNYRVTGKGPAVKPGLVVAIEPMITAGTIDTVTLDDDWTVATADGSMSSHWEHSIAVHNDGIWVLTAPDGGAAGLAPFGIEPVPLD